MADVDCKCSPPPQFLVKPPPKPAFMLTECDEKNGQFHAEENCEYYGPVLEGYFPTKWTPLMSLTVSVVSFLLFGLCVLLVFKQWRKFVRDPVEGNSVFVDGETQSLNDLDQEKTKKFESGDPKPHILAVAPEPPLFICYASEELFHPEYQVLPFSTTYKAEANCLYGTSISEEEYVTRPNLRKVSPTNSNDIN